MICFDQIALRERNPSALVFAYKGAEGDEDIGFGHRVIS
jgi:hypothetical protein